jgi:hypothetical protein
MSSPRSGDDQEGDGDGEGQGSSINSYDIIHRLIEHEEERKRELDRRLLELDAREKESRERLSAVRARNADLEREIAEWQAKVQSLEGSSASAGLGSSAGGEDLGSRSSRGPLPGTWDSLLHAHTHHRTRALPPLTTHSCLVSSGLRDNAEASTRCQHGARPQFSQGSLQQTELGAPQLRRLRKEQWNGHHVITLGL